MVDDNEVHDIYVSHLKEDLIKIVKLYFQDGE